ncbi:MAG: TRAP transporter large permease subunit [Deltaproteobacteria bacterium]|nr:TRAP transporter large permease subunit [Deltaproteobacteria bacterium]
MELALIIAFIIMALLGLRLFAVIGGLALILYLMADIGDIEGIVNEMYTLATQPVLLTIPLFTFAGYIMAESNAPKRLVGLSQALIEPLPGGLAIVSLVSCAFFTAFTGASGVTIIALGGLLFPALINGKYSEKFTLGLLTTSGSLGLLFPPSLAIILYGLVAGVSINKLFVAGIVPGIFLIVVLSIYSVTKNTSKDRPRSSLKWKKIKSALYDSRYELPIPFVVLVGIYGGYLTVIDTAAMVALYVLIIEFFVYKDIPIKKLPDVVKESMLLVGGIFIIICTAKAFTYYLVDQDIPQSILEWMQTYIHSKLTFLIVLNIFLIIVGCLMDIFSAILVVVPLIAPIAAGFEVNPVHLGIIFLVNLEIGYSTPPVGLNLFIASFRFKKPVMSLYKASLPFLAILIIALMIITYVPQLSLFLVDLFEVK